MRNRLSLCSLMRANFKVAICIFLTLATFQLGGCSNSGVGIRPEGTKLRPEVIFRLQEILDAALADEASKYPGAILRLETPKGSWSGTSGVASVNTNKAIDPLAKFRAASILKTFVATVVLQLMEEGKLSLDDRLSDLLEPEIAGMFEYSDYITLKMLLNHTSGIGEWVGEYDLFLSYPRNKIWKDKEFLDLAVKAGTNFKPGERYEYNNTEYTLLGLIIDRKSGISWRENIRQRIFARLGLKNTLLPEPGNTKIPGSHIDGYEMFNGVLTETTEFDPSMAGAAGGHSLVTNTEDLAVYIQALLKGNLFDRPETLSAMLTGVASGPGRSYGLGIGRITLPDGRYAYGHTGGTAGYASMAYHFPKEDITVTTVISTDQFDAILKYLLPSLELVTESFENQNQD